MIGKPAASTAGLAVESAPVAARRVLRGDIERPVVATVDFVLLFAAAAVNVASPGTAVVFLAFAYLALSGTRVPGLQPSAFQDVPALVARMLIAAALCLPVALVGGAPGAFGAQVVVSLAAVLVGRGASYLVVRETRRRGRTARRSVIIGEHAPTTRAVETFTEHPELGLEVVAMQSSLPLPDGIEAVVVVELVPGANRWVRSLAEAGVLVYVTADAAEHVAPSRRDRLETVLGEPLVRLAPAAMRRPGWRLKRAFDIVASIGGLVVLSPVFLFAAVGTKLCSRGPVLFRQARVGRDQQIFTMYKIRTFPIEHVDDKFSLDHGECPLAFGRFLRRTSIDELPQLFNVLRGEMSIVGPRPERPHFAGPLSTVVADYDLRVRVPGGITGAAQVNGFWGNSCLDSRVALDNRYIDDWSFGTDAAILARTLKAVVRKSGV